MSTVQVAYGDTRLAVELPDQITVREVTPHAVPAADDPLGVVAQAIDTPVGAMPLTEAAKGAGSVAIVVPDRTRPHATRYLLLPVLARLAHAGLVPQQIRIVMARGIHPPTPRNEVETLLGRDVLRGLRPVQSAPDTPELNETIHEHPRLGTVRVHRQVATADLVVLTGYVRPHHLSGFGGGPKALVPGVAERDSVIAAHRLTLDTLVRPDGSIRPQAGRLDRNPFRRALLDVTDAFGKAWLVNAVVNAEGGIVAAAAGGVREAHEAAVAAWQDAFDPPTPEPADLVIVGGRPPHDLDLIQAHKALLGASAWAKPGAPIVWGASAPNGPGHDAFLPWFTAGKLPIHLASLRERFHPYGLTAYSLRRIAKDHPVHIVSRMSGDLTRPMGLLHFEDAQAAVDHALKTHDVASCVVIPNGGV
ncbi:MAG: nickel-dependent lactate racemase [Planctomycetota bacterium]|nr:nickel-dependent lactate racemase [Planctomycetota bacterium]